MSSNIDSVTEVAADQNGETEAPTEEKGDTVSFAGDGFEIPADTTNEDASYCMRCYRRFRDTNPRMHAILFRILMPLWVLVLLCLLGGFLLALLEAPDEYDRNDFILRARYILKDEIPEGPNKVSVDVADSALTFNWVKCLRPEFRGYLNYRPSKEEIETANNQSGLYEDKWNEDRERILDECKSKQPEGGNETDRVCIEMSIDDASGRKECNNNIGGTGWFWFTVMTTVGYGNQAPATFGGRLMVSTFGLVSILLFGGILANTGNILNVIFDDMVSRCRLRILARPLVAIFLWAFIAAAWMLFLGWRTHVWWDERMLNEDVPSLAWDSLWFAYISTTTIGFGDYFLQPELMFPADVFRFSFLFLTGFAFLSMFLGKVVELLNDSFPDAGKMLKERLKKTNLRPSITFLRHEGNEQAEEVPMPETSKTLEILKELLQREESKDDKCSRPNRSLEVVAMEEKLLSELLERRISELMLISTGGNI